MSVLVHTFQHLPPEEFVGTLLYFVGVWLKTLPDVQKLMQMLFRLTIQRENSGVFVILHSSVALEMGLGHQIGLKCTACSCHFAYMSFKVTTSKKMPTFESFWRGADEIPI